MTVGLMHAMIEIGILCPQELSTVGFDDFDTGLEGFSLASLFNPKLTTIRQPAYEMGRRAFEMLLRRMTRPEKDSSVGETLTLDAELIIRNSTARPGEGDPEMILSPRLASDNTRIDRSSERG
jgi:DNA-binding LacI/PurR family transcriptional regulator